MKRKLYECFMGGGDIRSVAWTDTEVVNGQARLRSKEFWKQSRLIFGHSDTNGQHISIQIEIKWQYKE